MTVRRAPQVDRRRRTRAKLVAAARVVMATNGVDNATIAEIAEAASVGFGTFYNHFQSKAEIAETVLQEMVEDLRKIIESIRMTERDIACAVALVQKTILTKVVQDPIWGWFIVKAGAASTDLLGSFAEMSTADIFRGQQEGRFHLADVATARMIISSALMAAARLLLTGEAPADLAQHLTESLLRMLGVAADEAGQLARLDLPDYVAHHM